MKLLARWNRYLPRWLWWLARRNVEPELHEDTGVAAAVTGGRPRVASTVSHRELVR
jgi:hypothetical protein